MHSKTWKWSSASFLQQQSLDMNKKDISDMFLDSNSDHLTQGLYVCRACMKSFRSSQGFFDHVCQQHLKKFRFFCKQCQKGFVQKQAYEGHMNVHTGARPFVCQCGKSFPYRSTLAAHQKVCSSLDVSNYSAEAK